MDKIICLVGASGSGKTTLAKELEGKGYNIIHSYTTRQEREPGEWGHIFMPPLSNMEASYINHSGLTTLDIEGTIKERCPFTNRIEYKPYIIYNTNVIAFKEVYEGLYYWATKEQYQGKGTSIYVVDPQGAEQVHENVKDAEVITIFLMVDRENRYNRLHKRKNLSGSELINLPNKIDDIWGRLNADEEIFKTCKCDYAIDANREIEEILKDILEVI